MLQLRWALNEASKVGRPLMQDLDTAIEALTLDPRFCASSHFRKGKVADIFRPLSSKWSGFLEESLSSSSLHCRPPPPATATSPVFQASFIWDLVVVGCLSFLVKRGKQWTLKTANNNKSFSFCKDNSKIKRIPINLPWPSHLRPFMCHDLRSEPVQTFSAAKLLASAMILTSPDECANVSISC